MLTAVHLNTTTILTASRIAISFPDQTPLASLNGLLSFVVKITRDCQWDYAQPKICNRLCSAVQRTWNVADPSIYNDSLDGTAKGTPFLLAEH